MDNHIFMRYNAMLKRKPGSQNGQAFKMDSIQQIILRTQIKNFPKSLLSLKKTKTLTNTITKKCTNIYVYENSNARHSTEEN